MLSSVLPVLMRSPPITKGYSLPSWPFTLSIDARLPLSFFLVFFCKAEAPGAPTYLSSPLAGLLQFFDLAFDDFALERRHAIQENDAVAVVRFVQHAARGQLSSVQLKLFSIDVMRAHDCPQLALDAEKYSGKGKTTLIAILLAFLSYHFRIDHDDALRGVFAARTIHHEEALGYADLHGRQAHAGRRIHGFKHIVDELFQIVIEFGYRIGGIVEHRIRPGNYL